jgi:hypothetical protein
MGVKTYIFITYEQGISELVARGVKDGMGIASAVDFP